MAAAGKAAGPVAAGRVNGSQQPRCKQRGVKLAALQSSGVFDPRGSRQMCMQACPLGSLPAEMNHGLRRNALKSRLSRLAWEDSSSLAAAHSSLVAEFVWTTIDI